MIEKIRLQIRNQRPQISQKQLKNPQIHAINFFLLFSVICDDADCQKEIRRKLAMGCSTMIKLTKIMKNKDISVATKTELVYSLVFPVVAYGSES